MVSHRASDALTVHLDATALSGQQPALSCCTSTQLPLDSLDMQVRIAIWLAVAAARDDAFPIQRHCLAGPHHQAGVAG